ncbi:MAG: response regulator [Bdellovibrionaceae bacterium]|nr:response regulator [Pseudobdellovibrionaceae bacterium]
MDTFKGPRFENKIWERGLATLALALLGWALNQAVLPLFFGVDFIFGSVATLIAIAVLGRTAGIIVAIVAALHTYFLWDHPYAAIVLVGEAVFVGAIWKKTYANLPIATAIYWLFLGIGQIWFYYSFLLGMDEMGAQFAAVKQACNGILNALVVHLLVTYGPLARWSLAPIRFRSSVFQPIFGFLALAAILPALLFFTLNSRQMVNQIEENIRLRLDTIGTALAMSSERWRDQNMAFVRTASAVAQRGGLSNRSDLQHLLERLNSTASDIFSIFVGDENGRSIAFDPLVNAYGVSNLGIDISDRTYFQRLKRDGDEASVSPIFMGRGAYREPVIVVAHAIRANEKFKGLVAGAVNLKNLQRLLTAVKGEGLYVATILDEHGKVIVSTDPGLHSMDDFSQERLSGIEKGADGFFRRGLTEDGNPMNQWKSAWLGTQTVLEGPGQWNLIVEIPYAPAQASLYQQYLKSLGGLLLLLIGVILVSFWIAWWVSKPLMEFAVQTTDLPDRLEEADRIRWPRSPFIEFRALFSNMRAVTIELRKKFQDLQKSTAELQQTTKSLERVSHQSNERAHRQSFLAHAGKELGSSLETDAILERLSDLLVPEWADWCVVSLLDKRGNAQPGWIRHRDPQRENKVSKVFSRLVAIDAAKGPEFVLENGGPRFLPKVDPELLETLAGSPEDLEAFQVIGFSSYICVPLLIRGQRFGAVTLGRGTPFVDNYNEEDLEFVRDLVSRAAVAVDNARLYKEAQTLNRIKDEFLATLSHELRTPLSIILGHAEILKQDAPAIGTELDASVDAIFRNAQAQNQIISDLLDVSAIIAGKISFRPVATDLGPIARSATESIRFSADAKGVGLEAKISDQPMMVMADPTRMQQIIWNLLSNAVKFTPRGGKVFVRMSGEASRVVIEVKDTGQGIESDFIPYIFDRFRQEDNSMTRRHGGLGLGLSIVRQLVELHGGQINVASEGKNKGSVFSVTLPLMTAQASLSNSSLDKIAPNLPEDLRGKKILVVDDEPDARQMLIELFERAGAQPFASASASEGIAEYERRAPDLIVSDIGMPGEDGCSFLRRLREMESKLNRFTPALALTAFARDEDRRKVLAAGYQAHLSKPVAIQELLLVLSTLSRQYRN